MFQISGCKAIRHCYLRQRGHADGADVDGYFFGGKFVSVPGRQAKELYACLGGSSFYLGWHVKESCDAVGHK